jgi:ABC-type branched-subunit amino acid transport system substrate-binding protein
LLTLNIIDSNLMKQLRLLIFTLIFFTSQGLYAQSDLQNRYLNGKDLYKLGKYELAMEVFRNIVREEENNDFLEYASFYYALSAYKANQLIVAENMLLQITHKFPNWHQKDEALYWLARMNFEKNNLLKGLNYLRDIKDKSVKEDGRALKTYYISQVDDIEKMKDIMASYPADKENAEVIAAKLKNMPASEENLNYLKEIVTQFHLDPKKFLPEELKTKFKESYNVAVMFPFMNDELSPSRGPKGNQFVLDMYEGFRLAQKQLEEEGVKLNLFAYDTRRDSTETALLLQKDEMKTMDLIVGPLYPVPVKLVSAFSMENKINMINPMSNNSSVIGNNPFSFLYKSSVETQAKRAADFAAETFPRTNALVLYTSNPRDTLMASIYRKRLLEEGFCVEMLKSTDAKTIIDYLTNRVEDLPNLPNEPFVVPLGSIGHIFVASLNESVLANTITSIEVRGDKIPLLGHEDWLNSKFISFDQLEKMNVYMLAPNFVDHTSDSVKAFRSKYQKAVNVLPNNFAQGGYDMMILVGRMLRQHGTKFQKYLHQAGYIEGELFPGYNYKGGNDNQFVPVIKFINAKLEVVNEELGVAKIRLNNEVKK